jgi:hypothetical protein
MKKFMQKDLSKAPNFVNRAILRTARVSVSEVAKQIRWSSRRHAGKDREKVWAGFKPAPRTQF